MPQGSSEQHRRLASDRGPVPLGLVTVSDTRTLETDENGAFLRERAEAAGHHVVFQQLVPDDPPRVSAAVREAIAAGARVVIFNGGTGISSRDNTFDAISALLEKTLPGFGEIFRMLSFEQVGAAAMLSRATAGVHAGSVILSIPGSPAAVRLAWDRLIEPEIAHLAWELTR